MKGKLTILISFVLVSCARPRIFVLKDNTDNKYYLSDSTKIAFRKGYIGKSPLIVIDGIIFKYQKNLHTIILPLKKQEITAIEYLNKKTSHVIYGANAVSGAIIINTTALQNSNDTIKKSRQ